MPRTNYVPSMHTPIGFAMPYYTEQREDKPTVEVDPYARGMEAGLIEAVCMALEHWEPVFVRYEDPPPHSLHDRETSALVEPYLTRQVPIFRGRHADKVMKFLADIERYAEQYQIEPNKQKLLELASKYVRIRISPASGQTMPFHHHNVTPYRREVIRPYLRKSDPEWDLEAVIAARKALLRRDMIAAHSLVLTMLDHYDKNRGTALAVGYQAEWDTLSSERACSWEHWRLVSYFVADIADFAFSWPAQGLRPSRKEDEEYRYTHHIALKP